MPQATIEEVATIMQGSRAVDELREDITSFLFLVHHALGRQGKLRRCITLGHSPEDHINLIFEYETVRVMGAKFGLRQDDPHDIRLHCLPVETAIELYQLLPGLLDKVREIPGFKEEAFAFSQYQRAAALMR